MKEELQAYIALLKDRNLDAVPYPFYWVLLAMVFIPNLVSHLIGEILIIISFFIFYFTIRKIPDEYQRKELTIGLFLLYIGIEWFSAVEFQYKCMIPHLIGVAVALISYEIVFFIKIRMKIYSSDRPKRGNAVGSIAVCCATMGGFWLSRIISNSSFIADEIKWWIMILLDCLILMYAFVYFQKFLILKKLK